MYSKLFVATLFSAIIAGNAYAQAPTSIPAPQNLQTAPIPVPASTPAEPAVDPMKVNLTKDKFRDHARQIYGIMNATKGDDKKQVYNQMIMDIAHMIRYGNTPRLKYSVIDAEEKKLATILADNVIDDKEMGEWHKDMRTKVIGDRADLMVNVPQAKPVKAPKPSPAPSK